MSDDVKMSAQLLTIGELARRAGVATSVLRYLGEIGLLPAAARIGGAITRLAPCEADGLQRPQA